MTWLAYFVPIRKKLQLLTCREILACCRLGSSFSRRLRGGASRKSCSRLGGRGGRRFGDSASRIVVADRGLRCGSCGGGSLSFGKAQVEARRGRRHFLVSVRSPHRTLRRSPVKVVVSIGFEMTVVT